MTATDLQNALQRLFDVLADARDEIEGDDDDITLADHARAMVDELDEAVSAVTFEDVAMLTSDAGLVIRTASGAEFQVTIVQSKRGNDSPSDRDD